MMVVALIDAIFVLPDGARWALSGAGLPGGDHRGMALVPAAAGARAGFAAAGAAGRARGAEAARGFALGGGTRRGEAGRGFRLRAVPRAGADATWRERMERHGHGAAAAGESGAALHRPWPRRSAVVCVAAFALTGFQFGTLLLRALLPGANLARVSRVQVQIVEPAPAEKRVPQGETVPLVIEISGQRANKAMLETFTPSGGARCVQMTPLGRRPVFRDDPGGARGRASTASSRATR